MTHPDWRQQLVFWVSQIVYWQVGLVLLISFGTFLLLVYRQWLNRQRKHWSQIYADQLVEELICNMENRAGLILPRLSSVQFIKMDSLKSILLAQITSISGAEKEYIISRYFELGLAKTDLVLCCSSFWWRRLEGVSNLRSLGSVRVASILQKMKEDPNEIVSAAALLGLSELDHSLNCINVQDVLPLIVRGRESSLVQISMNWSQVYGFESVFKPFKNYPEARVRDSLLIALTNVKTAESSNMFAKFLEHADFESPTLLAGIIRALREAGYPEGISSVIKYAHHPDERVQGQALEYILEFLPEEKYTELRIMELDPSPFVQRILKSWHLKRVA